MTNYTDATLNNALSVEQSTTADPHAPWSLEAWFGDADNTHSSENLAPLGGNQAQADPDGFSTTDLGYLSPDLITTPPQPLSDDKILDNFFKQYSVKLRSYGHLYGIISPLSELSPLIERQLGPQKSLKFEGEIEKLKTQRELPKSKITTQQERQQTTRRKSNILKLLWQARIAAKSKMTKISTQVKSEFKILKDFKKYYHLQDKGGRPKNAKHSKNFSNDVSVLEKISTLSENLGMDKMFINLLKNVHHISVYLANPDAKLPPKLLRDTQRNTARLTLDNRKEYKYRLARCKKRLAIRLLTLENRILQKEHRIEESPSDLDNDSSAPQKANEKTLGRVTYLWPLSRSLSPKPIPQEEEQDNRRDDHRFCFG